VDYWKLDLELGQVKGSADLSRLGEELRHFREQHPDSTLNGPLRITWLKTLGLYQDWHDFEQTLDAPSLNDREVACLELQRRVSQNDPNALKEVRELWFKPGTPSASCIPLFHTLQNQGMLGDAEIIKPLRRAFASHDLALVKLIGGFISSENNLSDADIKSADQTPLRYLERLKDEPATPLRAELTAFALEQLARKDPATAAARLNAMESHLPTGLRAWVWQQIGRQGALIHDPHALEWFNQGRLGDHEDELSGWWVRAALLKEDWESVLDAIASMSAEEQKRPAWQYWQAHALLATGNGLKARKLLKALSHDSSFYGLLALEALGQTFTPPPEGRPVEAAERDGLDASLNRALRLRTLGLIAEARTEWAAQNRKFTPRQRHVAADWAARHFWYDRAIYSIDRADNEGDLALKFPLPERDLLHTHCQELSMDEAWVYGLMRQESHFVNDAKSRTGASGLMQIMPATARWVAKKIPLKGFNLKQLSEPKVNVRMGVWFLHHLHEITGNAVLATAGYNGGPGRVSRWLATSPNDVPIFIETIPFDETRGYVQKVMYNATVYNHRLGLPSQSLNQRLGNAGKMKELLQQTGKLEELEELP
jgi:soluble lytic murein transglycosylase